MLKSYKTFIVTLAFILIFGTGIFAQDSPPEPSSGMHIILDNVDWPPADYTDLMKEQLGDLRQAADVADEEGRPGQAEQLRRRADNMEREIDERAGELERDRIHRAEEQLEHLRNMTREAEEIVNNLRGDMARRDMDMERPMPEPIFRPFPQEPFVERHNPEPEPRFDVLIDIGNDIRNLLAEHLERTEELLHRNREQVERKIQQLREENERLRMQLRERNEANRNLERQIRRQAEERVEMQRQQLERREREMQQQLEKQVRRQAEQREIQRRQRQERKEQLERQRQELEIQTEPEVLIERPEEIEEN